MKKIFFAMVLLGSLLGGYAQEKNDTIFVRTHTENGVIEGFERAGVKIFRGIPYAQPPVGELRWREPQPVKDWKGVKKTIHFGPRAMQLPVFGDMRFRSNGMSEDCLYLNVWTPSKNNREKLPVLVYFYGGGFIAGDGSEYRYDGESMARHGIVMVTINYRLGIFGFFSHPELTRESPHCASGNYGLLDQCAALQWVKRNIAYFGGDPDKITIGGESAGSFSVSAQMASPLSRNLIAGAIGESGSLMGFRAMPHLSEAEKAGLSFQNAVGAKNLNELRNISADQLLGMTKKRDLPSFGVIVDGYFFPAEPETIFLNGEQAQVPLLVGWNSMESNYKAILGEEEVTVENYEKAVRKRYPDIADGLLTVYKPNSDEEVAQVATDLASDMFIGYGTWNWSDIHAKTGNREVYRYYFVHPRPGYKNEKTTDNLLIRGASHSAEIEYVLGNLPVNDVYDWQSEDYFVSTLSQLFFAHFIKTGNPNGLGVPVWLPVKPDEPANVMIIGGDTRLQKEQYRERYLYLRNIHF